MAESQLSVTAVLLIICCCSAASAAAPGPARASSLSRYRRWFQHSRSLAFKGSEDAATHLNPPHKTGSAGPADAAALCAIWGLQPAAKPNDIKVFDLFVSSHELDMIEIRLQELHEVVDHFVVLESRQTHRGRPRRLAFPYVLHRLPGRVLSKVHYTVLDVLPGNSTWDREIGQRNELLKTALATSSITVRPTDVLLVSDTDKVPKPSFVRAMKLCTGIKYPAALESTHHYYSFDYVSGYAWDMGPRATLRSALADPGFTGNKMRKDNLKGVSVTHYKNAAWHCSYCFHRAALFKNKLSTFAHDEFDTPTYHDLHRLMRCLKEGWNLFQDLDGADATTDFHRVPQNELDAPSYVVAHPDRFRYLLTRGGDEAANLVDVAVRDGKAVWRRTDRPGRTDREEAEYHAHLTKRRRRNVPPNADPGSD